MILSSTYESPFESSINTKLAMACPWGSGSSKSEQREQVADLQHPKEITAPPAKTPHRTPQHPVLGGIASLPS
jgi:hypothetical protein